MVKLFSEPQHFTNAKANDDPHAGLTEIDYEEQTAGYQAAYSRLAASESAEVDPVGYVQDPQQFLGQALVAFSNAVGSQQAKDMIAAGNQSTVGPFLQALNAAGYVL